MSVIDGERSGKGISEHLRERERKSVYVNNCILIEGSSHITKTATFRPIDGAWRQVRVDIEDIGSIVFETDDWQTMLEKLDYRVYDEREPLY